MRHCIHKEGGGRQGWWRAHRSSGEYEQKTLEFHSHVRYHPSLGDSS